MQLSLVAIALLISFNTSVFATEEGKSVAPLRLEARINEEKWTGDLGGIAKRRLLRILVAPSALGFYFNGTEIQGALYEFGRELENDLNRKLKTRSLPINVIYIPVAREEMIAKLAALSCGLPSAVWRTAVRNLSARDPVFLSREEAPDRRQGSLDQVRPS